MTSIATHARRRYPGVPTMYAVALLTADRRTAGLGALDAAHRIRRLSGDGYGCEKYRAAEIAGVVVYRMSFYRPAGWKADEFAPLWPGLTVDVRATIRRVPLPEITLVVKHVAWPEDFVEQDRRDRLAWELRRRRRELRAAVDAAR